MKTLKIIFATLILLGAGSTLLAQSSEQEFPTPLTTNELKAIIEPKAIGDSRVTTYYYNFDGTQGDIFVNIVTKNLNGDIDIFVRDGLRLLTKVVVYADVGDGETGRVVYLRKPEKLLLRVRGRTPNDDPASIQIKFAGSFVAAVATEVPDAPRVAKRTVEEARPAVKQVELADKRDQEPIRNSSSNHDAKPSEAVVKSKTQEDTVSAPRSASKTTKPQNTSDRPSSTTRPSSSASRQRTAPVARSTAEKNPPATRPSKPAPESKTETARSEETAPEQKLVVEFIDGSRIERSMNDVLRFTVDRGVLTIIDKNGRMRRYQMSTVKKLSIE